MLLVWIIVFSTLGSLGAIAGAALMLLFPEGTRKSLLPFLISYATGTLLGAAFLGMIPKALQSAAPMDISSIILGGIVLFFVLEKVVIWRLALCTGAVQQAMPMLRQAREVTIGVFDPVMTEDRDGKNPGSELAEWLSRHGCNVRVNQYPSGGKEIGDCIIGRAKETGADLVVMGAYGHSRLREDLFGGTTRTLIEQQDLPVLLVH